jgi:hypothetical protein
MLGILPCWFVGGMIRAKNDFVDFTVLLWFGQGGLGALDVLDCRNFFKNQIVTSLIVCIHFWPTVSMKQEQRRRKKEKESIRRKRKPEISESESRVDGGLKSHVSQKLL